MLPVIILCKLYALARPPYPPPPFKLPSTPLLWADVVAFTSAMDRIKQVSMPPAAEIQADSQRPLSEAASTLPHVGSSSSSTSETGRTENRCA